MAKQKYWDGEKWVQIAPSMKQFNEHQADYTSHITAEERTTWNNKQDALNDNQKRAMYSGTTEPDPTTGNDGDLYFQYE